MYYKEKGSPFRKDEWFVCEKAMEGKLFEKLENCCKIWDSDFPKILIDSRTFKGDFKIDVIEKCLQEKIPFECGKTRKFSHPNFPNFPKL